MLLQQVSREEVNALPIRRYEGAVHVIAAPDELAPAMDDILQETLVGFDTETRPAFRPGESYPPSLAQVATARAVYLFQVQRADIAAAVARMLSEEHIVKAGVGMADDLKSLKKVVAFHEKSIADRRHAGAAPRPEAERRAQPLRACSSAFASRRAPRLPTGRGTSSPSSRSSMPRPTHGRAASST